MKAAAEVAFLFNVDNTLLDNDRVEGDLRDHLEGEFGPASRDCASVAGRLHVMRQLRKRPRNR